MSKNFVSRHKLTLYFTLVLIISWSIWIPMALDHLDIIKFPIPLIVGQTLGAFGILITLIILEKTTNKEVNVNKIFSTIRLKKAHIVWFVLAAFTIPSLTILGNFLNFLAGIDPQFAVLQQGPLFHSAAQSVFAGHYQYALIQVRATVFESACIGHRCASICAERLLPGKVRNHHRLLLHISVWSRIPRDELQRSSGVMVWAETVG